jgi:MtN3 and saliva related transmembrane protein
MIDFIGTVAAILTTVSFVPQVWKIWSTKSAKDVSLPMYLLFAVGVMLWLVYGIMLAAAPIIVANVITLALVCALIAMKLKWG